MPNARVPASGGAMSAGLPTMDHIATAVLRRSAARLDRMRHAVERELNSHLLARHRVETLIEQLIDSLDRLDGDGEQEDDDPDEDDDASDDDDPGEDDLDEEDGGDEEPALGWTDREARLGRYQHNPQHDEEPTLGREELHERNPQTFWGGLSGAPPKDDELDQEITDAPHDDEWQDREHSIGWAESESLTGDLRQGWDHEDAEWSAPESAGAGFARCVV